MPGKLPFTVIGGYLGAGKTTLLNAMLAQSNGLRLAVLVNDFGAVNVDAALITGQNGETMSLANGCLCCGLSNGFASAIAEVLKRADQLDHIVIEASGVAEPGKIARYGQMYDLPLDGVLVVADAEQVRTQAANKYVGDTVRRQLAQADLILLNKTDLVGPEALAELHGWLKAQAPFAPVKTCVQSDVPLEVLLGGHRLGAATMAATFAPDTPHDAAYRSWVIERDRPVTRAAFQRLADRLGARVLRAKGFVHLTEEAGQRQLFQLVGRRWSLTDLGPSPDPAPGMQVVVIAARG